MKRNYKYEKEMLHWLDGGEIEQTCFGSDWEHFDGDWLDDVDWQYRIAETKEKPKEERWLYVQSVGATTKWFSTEKDKFTIGKIRMEDV